MFANKLSKNRNCRSRRRGAMVVLVAIMMIVLLGMVAFGVDVGYLAANKTQLQAAADAAALAGATSLALDWSPEATTQEAQNYSLANTPQAYTAVSLGVWDPATKIFTPGADPPNAVKANVEMTQDRGNAVPAFFGRVFGHERFDVAVEAIAVGATPNATTSATWVTTEVYVTSTKDLSNVVLRFEDDSHQKFEGISGYSGTFQGTGQHAGKIIVGVWTKSGCYTSEDGPGYGEYIGHPGDGTTVHGNIANKGCNAHVTATFGSSGAIFSETGSHGPVRLVK